MPMEPWQYCYLSAGAEVVHHSLTHRRTGIWMVAYVRRMLCFMSWAGKIPGTTRGLEADGQGRARSSVTNHEVAWLRLPAHQ